MWYTLCTGREGEGCVAASVSGDIPSNVARVRARIAAAAARAGRDTNDICLLAVSKTVPPERVREALAAGITDLGENYVQEAAAKRVLVPEPARWHLIGHLQRNKVAQAVPIFDIVHTVDSARLAEALGAHARAHARTLEILLQVNTSGEESKSGVAPAETERLLEAVRSVEGVEVRGLMTIGRWDPDPERSRPEFRLLAKLAQTLAARTGQPLPWLSMGMSHDYEIAVEEGATLVRVGTGIFGPRPT